MIKSAAQPPAERKAYINRCINEIAQLPNDETVKSFDIRIEPSMLTVHTPPDAPHCQTSPSLPARAACAT